MLGLAVNLGCTFGFDLSDHAPWATRSNALFWMSQLECESLSCASSMFRTTLTALLPLFSFFTRLYPREQPQSFKCEPTRLQFELRHQHAVSPDAHVVFADIPRVPTSTLTEGNGTTHTITTKNLSIFRPPSFRAHEAARIRSIRHAQSIDLPWYEYEIVGPNVEDREALLGLAKMSNNAYVALDDVAWYELGDEWDPVRRSSWVTGDWTTNWVVFMLSVIRLVGNPTRTEFAVTSLRRPTTRPSCSPSRVPRRRYSEVAVRRAKRTG